jgi:hypothetical protein
MRRLQTALLLVLGSFCVYCVEDVAQHIGSSDGGARDLTGVPDGRRAGGDGPVGEAGAADPSGACCVPDVPPPTILADGPLPTSKQTSGCVTADLDVSAYRVVVVQGATWNQVEMKHGQAGYFLAPTGNGSSNLFDTHWGTKLRINIGATSSLGGCGATPAVTIVGYKQ